MKTLPTLDTPALVPSPEPDLLGSSLPKDDFWRGRSLQELAIAQAVGPIELRTLIGTWPGDMDDGFNEDVCATGP